MPIDYFRRVHRGDVSAARKSDSENQLLLSGDDDSRALHCHCYCLIPPLPLRRHYAAVPHAHIDTDFPFHDQNQSSEAP